MTTTPFTRTPGQPRDPSRIDIVLSALRAYWLANPDLRLGQIVVNAAGGGDPFGVEDEVLMAGWPVAPETPASDLAGLAARGQATQPAPRAPRICWTCRHANPDLRLGQIVTNAAGGGDPFGVEDDVLIAAWPVSPETPASDLVGLAARGQATQPAPHAPRTCWTCRSACADGSGCSYAGVMEVARRRWCSAAGNLDPDTEQPLPGAAPCPAFVGRA